MEIYMFLIAFPFLCIVFVLLYLFFKKDLKPPESPVKADVVKPVVEDMRGSKALNTSADRIISVQRDTPKTKAYQAIYAGARSKPTPIPVRSTAMRETHTTHYSSHNDTTTTDLLLLAALADAMESKPTVMSCPPAPEYRPDSYSTPAPSPSYNSCRSDSYSSSSDSYSSSNSYSSSDSGSSFSSDD